MPPGHFTPETIMKPLIVFCLSAILVACVTPATVKEKPQKPEVQQVIDAWEEVQS